MRVYLLIGLLFLVTFLSAQNLYTKVLRVKDGLPQEQVLSIFQDSIGQMWFGTNGGGLAVYNGKFQEYIGESKGILDPVIYDIKSFDKATFVATNGGLFEIRPDTVLHYNDSNFLKHNRVFALLPLNDSLILSTGLGVFTYKKGQIKQWFTRTKFDSLPIINTSFLNNQFFISSIGTGSMVVDKRGKVKELPHLNLIDKNKFSVNYFNDHYYFLGYNSLIKTNPKFEIIDTVFDKGFYNSIVDSKNQFWIASEHGLYKLSGNKTSIYRKDQGLSDNSAWKIFEDLNGRIWIISKTNGVTTILDDNLEIIFDQNGMNINSFEFFNDEVWLGSEKGLLLGVNDNYRSFESDNEEINTSIQKLKKWEGNLYVGTKNNGLFVIDPNGRDKQIVSEDPNLNRIYDIQVLNNRIFLGTQLGLAEFNGDGIVPISNQDKGNIFSVSIYKERIVFGGDLGVYELNLVDNTIKLLVDKKCRTIFNVEDELYLGLFDGFYKYSDNGIELINEINGVSSASCGLYHNGKIWIGVGNQVMIYDKNTWKKKVIEFPGGVINRNSIQNINGEIYVGGSERTVRFDDNYWSGLKSEPTIDWYSFDKVSEEYFKDFLRSGETPKFPNYMNTFSFQLWSKDYVLSDKLVYQWKFETDKNWNIIDNPSNFELSNLNPGNYTLLVRAKYFDELSNQLKLEFRIKKPFYYQWWFIFICVMILGLGVYYNVRIQKANKLIVQKNEEIEYQNKEIIDSINYAKRLQNAILPNSKQLTNQLGEHFVFFEPKDVVSGDFYWMKVKGTKVIWSVVDCTGHGVPGAIVSMVGNGALNRCVNEFDLIQTNEILDKLAGIVEESFNQEGSQNVKDGMDIAMCSWDRQTNEFQFSGAFNSAYIVRNGEEEIIEKKGKLLTPALTVGNKSLYELKGDKQPIGYYEDRKPFKSYNIKLQKGDSIYVFTDGYADQFGGPKGKKFKYRPFKKLLIEISEEPMALQKMKLHQSIIDWKGRLEQVDDICVFGWRL